MKRPTRQEGSALKDGFTVTGRRPLSHSPGDIRSLAEADRIDEREARWNDMGIGGQSRRSRIMQRTHEEDPTIVAPLDDNEEYF